MLSVSLGQVAALIAAIAFLLLCGALAVPILRLRHTVDAATQSINDLNDRTGPILGNVNTTLENVNTALGQTKVTLDGVNLQLARLDTITDARVPGDRERGQPDHRGDVGRGESRWARPPPSATACVEPPPAVGPLRKKRSFARG